MTEIASHQTKDTAAASQSTPDAKTPDIAESDAMIFRSLAHAGAAPPLKPSTIRRLNTLIGNQAVQRMMQTHPQQVAHTAQLPAQFLPASPQAIQRQEHAPPVRMPERVESGEPSPDTPIGPDEPLHVYTPEYAPETADEVIQHTLGMFIHRSVAEGRRIEGLVNVVDDVTWNRVGVTNYGARWHTDAMRHTREADGYVMQNSDGSPREVWIRRSRDGIHVMIHEAIHVYSNSITLYSRPLREGITEYFTRRVLRDLGLPVPDNYYPEETAIVETLVGVVTERIIADAYFDDEGDLLRHTFMLGLGETSENIYWTFTAYMQNAQWQQARDILAAAH